MPKLYANDGAIKEVQQPFIKMGAAWKKAKKVFYKHPTQGWLQHWPALTVIRVPAGTNRSLAQLASAAHADPTVAVRFELHSGDIVGSTNGTAALVTGTLPYPESTLIIDGEVQAGTGTAFGVTSNITVINNGAIRGHGGNGGHGGKGTNSSKVVTTTKHVGAISKQYGISSAKTLNFDGIIMSTLYRNFNVDINITSSPCGTTGRRYVKTSTVICGIRFTNTANSYTLTRAAGTMTIQSTVNYTGGNGGAGGQGQRYNHAKSNGSNGADSNPTGGNSGGKGGDGGTWGAVGGNGVNGDGGGTSGRTDGTAFGNYVTGNAKVTWIKTGTRDGGVSS